MTAKTAPKITLWEFFQQLGKTFMLPVALLSFCGIMLGIGSSLSSHDVLTLLPWLDVPLLQAVFIWMGKVGSFAFSFLPVMFCIAIPLGLARENKGVAAFAELVAVSQSHRAGEPLARDLVLIEVPQLGEYRLELGIAQERRELVQL